MTEASLSMRLAQKNVLVTGAAAGLGRHIAQAFAAEGADIAILDFQDASATVREITGLKRQCEFFRSDVRDEDGVCVRDAEGDPREPRPRRSRGASARACAKAWRERAGSCSTLK